VTPQQSLEKGHRPEQSPVRDDARQAVNLHDQEPPVRADGGCTTAKRRTDDRPRWRERTKSSRTSSIAVAICRKTLHSFHTFAEIVMFIPSQRGTIFSPPNP